MTKVCFVNTIPSWGGGENWQAEVILTLKEQFDIISISHPNGQLYEKVKPYVKVVPFQAGKLAFLNPLKLYQLYRLFKQLAPDAILFNTSSDFKLFTFPARWAGVKNIIYRRDNGKPIAPHLINKYLLQKGITSFLPCSGFISNAALSKDKNLIPQSKINIIYNSISIMKWDMEVAEKLLEKQEGVVYFGCIGRLSKEKGQLFLPKIAQKLKEKTTNFKILIAGTGQLGEELKEEVKRTETQDFFEFLGFVRHSKDFMETVDCLLLPSLWEGLPTVAIEAMASKKPVIAFEVAGNPEVVIEGVSGLLVSAFDTAKFAERMSEMITNAERRKEMGERGRHLAEEKFSQEKTLEQLKVFFE